MISLLLQKWQPDRTRTPHLNLMGKPTSHMTLEIGERPAVAVVAVVAVRHRRAGSAVFGVALVAPFGEGVA